MLIHDARLLRDFIQIVETVLGVIIGGIRAEFEVRFNFLARYLSGNLFL